MVERLIFHPHCSIRRSDGSEQRIGPQGSQFLIYLMGHKFARHEELIKYLWPNPNTEPENAIKALNTIACNMRNHLEGTNWTVGIRHGQGYSLECADVG